jgi:serine/threonine protein kinase
MTSFQVPEIARLAELLPTFEFEHLIAEGGSSVIYKARQISLDRDVAIKILPREFAEQADYRRAFLAEAITMASLSHPNLIRVHDSGEVDGLPYMVMEHVPGNSLFRSAHGRAIDPEQAGRIILAACRGLAHAHAKGIVHGGIRPENILLNPQCEPKIGSFGLVRGDSAYAAPEAKNDPQCTDARADVHAIGVVFRELLTGIPAGEGRGEDGLLGDPRLAAICHKATREDPAERYADASELVGELENWVPKRGSRLITAAARPTVRPPSPARHRPASIAMPRPHPSPGRSLAANCAIIAVLLCALYFVWGVYQTKKADLARLQREQDAKPRVVKIIQAPRDSAAAMSPSGTASLPPASPLLASNPE